MLIVAKGNEKIKEEFKWEYLRTKTNLKAITFIA